jgi:hypothetical protein
MTVRLRTEDSYGQDFEALSVEPEADVRAYAVVHMNAASMAKRTENGTSPQEPVALHLNHELVVF